MTIKFVSFALGLLLILGSNTGFSADTKKPKYEILPPDRPCLFLRDESPPWGPVGDPVNAPCDLHTRTIQPGDTVDPKLREKYGKIYEAAQEVTPRKAVN